MLIKKYLKQGVDINIKDSKGSTFLHYATMFNHKKLIEFLIERKKAEMDFIQRTIEEINRRSFHIANTMKFLNFIHGEN